ncbi:MAG: glycosyltransferase family 39 protein [Candidatus Coatesbacteria bacterium]|nr:glycosyltransferase family 39 protein [Candidatus Coatesbacteria bacterium]
MAWKDYLICGLLVAFWAIGNIVWLALDNIPPVWDPAFHISDAIDASEAISRLDICRLLMLQGQNTFYPPLWHVLAGIFMLLFGKSVAVAIAANLLFIPAMVFGIFLVAKQLFDRRVGLLAACVGTLLPGLWGASRTAYIDFALSAMVTLFIALVLSPNRLEKRANCVALGLVFGLGMLTKWTFIVYVAGPSLAVLVRYLIPVIKPPDGFGSRMTNRKRLLYCLALFGLTAGAVCLPWYIANLANTTRYIADFDVELQKLDTSQLTPSLIGYYAQRLLSDQLFLPCLLLAIAGAALSVNKANRLLLLSSWIVVPLLFLRMIHWRDLRYTLPILPAFAILAGVALSRLFERRWSRVAAAFLMMLLFGQWLVVSYRLGYAANGLAIELGGVRVPIWGCIAQDARPAISIKLPYDEMAAHISRLTPRGCSAFVVPVTDFVNPWTLRLEARLANKTSLKFTYGSFRESLDGYLDSLLSSDFVVCKDGRQGEVPYDTKALVLGGILLRRIRAGAIRASLVEQFALPDGSSVYVLGPNRISHEETESLKERFLCELERLRRPQRPGRFISPNEPTVFARFPELIQWTPAEDALWYVVRLSGPAPTTELRVCGERLTLARIVADLTPPGNYTIEVAAANLKGRSEWLKGAFTVGRRGPRPADRGLGP